MSQKPLQAQLLIEWDREWVRVHSVESGQNKEASTLDGIEGVNGKTAVVLLSRRLVLHRTLTLPDAAKGDALIALKMKISDVFPIPASELAFDFIPTTDKNENGRVCNVFAAKTTDIAEVIAVCQRFGIQIQQIVPAQALTIKVAEKYAVSSGVFVERFGDSVNLDAFKYGELAASKMVSLDTLDNELARMQAMVGEGSTLYSYNVRLNGTEQTFEAPYLNSFYQTVIGIDLEPDDYRTLRLEKSRKQRHKQAYYIFISAVLLAAFVVNSYMDRATTLAKEDARYKGRTKNLSLITQKDENDANKLKPQVEQLIKAFEPAQQPSDILKVISMLVPKDTWLTSVTFERGKLLQIRGVSKKSELVSAYAAELTKQKRLRDVRLVSATSSDIEGIPTVQFVITAFPVGNLPILEVGKKKK